LRYKNVAKEFDSPLTTQGRGSSLQKREGFKSPLVNECLRKKNMYQLTINPGRILAVPPLLLKRRLQLQSRRRVNQRKNQYKIQGYT